MLAEIYSWFTEGLETRGQQEAKALREEFPPERSGEGLGVLPSPTPAFLHHGPCDYYNLLAID